jgi:hypothetical protein
VKGENGARGITFDEDEQLNFEEGLKRRLKRAGFTLTLCFICACISFTLLCVLEQCTVNKHIYYAAGVVCCAVSSMICVVMKELVEKAYEREDWEASCRQAGRFTPEHLEKGRE